MTAAPETERTLPVTVLIPAYNRADMVRRALESVAAQSPGKPAEVIVIDDCSDDDTVAVAESMGAWVIRHERNMGAATARNTGIEAASNEWVALLDSDDLWLPHHLDTLWRLRDDHVVVAAAALRCANGSATGRYLGPAGRRPVVVSTPATLIYPANFIPAMGVMVRKERRAGRGRIQHRAPLRGGLRAVAADARARHRDRLASRDLDLPRA